MKIFLVLSSVPYENGEAIDVVSYEELRLMAAAGHDITVQVLIREGSSEEMGERSTYVQRRITDYGNVEVLPIIYLGDLQPSLSRHGVLLQYAGTVLRSLPPINRMINSYFFPALAAEEQVHGRVTKCDPDIVLSIWSWEALAVTYKLSGVPKFVYYGNPNHKPSEAQMRYPALFDIPTQGGLNWVRFRLYKLFNRAREIQHLKMMKCCEVTANNSLVDAQYYQKQGHLNSVYLQNMWPEPPDDPTFGGCIDPDGPLRIAGSVGNLGATGNTFGLNYLGEKLLPELEQRLIGKEIIVDVYGGGQARKRVAKMIQHDSIYLRGWVNDLTAELHKSHVFLVLTNVDGFIVGNTRILLAWALGACVVAHANSALSMPEIKHMENALLGETPEQLAELIIKAAEDDQLRERFGRGGFETFQRDYRSDKVVPRMLEAMEQCVDDYRYGRQQRC